MPKRLILVFLFALAVFATSNAQELNVTVSVNDQKIQSVEKRIYRDMEKNFAQFMNERQWTEDEFSLEERIKCNIFITIETAPTPTSFTAVVQVQVARPVYGTNYETLLLNFADRDWTFEYLESKPLNFNENTYTNNLTSMLAFYAYIILGLDYDSFEKTSGDIHYSNARKVVTNAQQNGRKGWTQFDSNRNRFWLSENLSRAQFLDLREAFYDYHRLGMDVFLQNPDESRKVLLDVIKRVKSANDINPNAVLILSFMETKSAEIVRVFSEGDPAIRREVYDLLMKITPSRASDYQPIIKN